MILMGTGPFAVPSFEAIRVAGHSISTGGHSPATAGQESKGSAPFAGSRLGQSTRIVNIRSDQHQ